MGTITKLATRKLYWLVVYLDGNKLGTIHSFVADHSSEARAGKEAGLIALEYMHNMSCRKVEWHLFSGAHLTDNEWVAGGRAEA